MSFSKDLAVMEMNGFKLNGKQIQFPVYHVSEMPIEELNLGVRASNGLKRAGIMTVDGILERDLGKVRNLGAKSVKEIKNAVLNYSYERMNQQQKAEFWKNVLV